MPYHFLPFHSCVTTTLAPFAMPCVPTAPASRKRNNKQNICNLSFPFERNTTPVKGAQNLVVFTCLRQKLSTQCKKKPCALKYAVSQHKFTNSLQNATKLPTCATQISKVAKGITNATNLRQTYTVMCGHKA